MFFSEADIDECAEGIIECHNHSRCVNLPGWYHCECRSGFHDNGSYSLSGESCVGKQWSPQRLLFILFFFPPPPPAWCYEVTAEPLSRAVTAFTAKMRTQASVSVFVSIPDRAVWVPVQDCEWLLQEGGTWRSKVWLHCPLPFVIRSCCKTWSQVGFLGSVIGHKRGRVGFSIFKFQQSDMGTHWGYTCVALICLFSIIWHLHRFIFRITQIASSSLCTRFAEQDPKSMDGEEFLKDVEGFVSCFCGRTKDEAPWAGSCSLGAPDCP